MAFLRAASTLLDIVIWGFQNQSFGRPGASTLAPLGPVWHLGDTLWGPEPDDAKHSLSDWSCSGKALAC